jgi:hypothetical protein
MAPLRPPSVAHGVLSFIWGLVFGLYVWLGALAVGVQGATAFIVGALVGAGSFLYVRIFGVEQPRRQSGRRAGRAR